MDFLKSLGIQEKNKGVSTGSNWIDGNNPLIESYSPVDGKLIGSVSTCTKENYDKVIETANAAFLVWRNMPAPARGEIVRQVGEALRKN